MLIHEKSLPWSEANAMILANNTNWDSSQLFGCASDKDIHHLIFITALLLVWSLGHMDPQVKDWVTKHGQVPRVFELVTHLTIWLWRLSLLNHS